MLQMLIKDFKEFFRDGSSLFFILLFPSLLVLLLGNLLSSFDNPDGAVGTLRLQALVETRDPASAAAVEAFLDGLNENGVAFTPAESREQAQALVRAGELDAAVVFGEPLSVTIYEGAGTVQNRTVRSLLTAFTKAAGAGAAIQKIAPESLPLLAQEKPQQSYLAQKDLGVNRSMLDYYAVAMTVMILFMGGMGGAASLQEERLHKTMRRMLISPRSKAALYVQKILGSTPQVLLQVTVVMVFSSAVFGARYAARWQDNLLLFLLFFVCGLSFLALFSILGLYLNINCYVVFMPILWVMMFLSGTFSKEIFIPGLTECMPTYQIQNAAFDLTVFGRQQKAWAVLAVCTVVFVLSLVLGTVLFQRRRSQ